MSPLLRRVGTDDETLAGLGARAGYDDDLAARSTRLTNRLRDALLPIHPARERLLGKHFDRGGVLELLTAAPTPAALRELGAEQLTKIRRPPCPFPGPRHWKWEMAVFRTRTTTISHFKCGYPGWGRPVRSAPRPRPLPAPGH